MNEKSGERENLLDRLAVADVIVRERIARDNHDWTVMAECYHEDSFVETSWFRGTGRDFVAASRKIVRPASLNFHILQPFAVIMNGDRAIAEMPCTLRSFGTLGDAEVSLEGFVRLLWRARRAGDTWLIAGLRAIFVRDIIIPCDPARPPRIDGDKLDAFRPSYRYLSYQLTELGVPVRGDLPGVDRPEMVTALRNEERAWLDTPSHFTPMPVRMK